MKKLFLMATMLLTIGFLNAQSADYFVKNSDLMVSKSGSTSTFAEGYSDPITDFAEGILNGKNYLIYWTNKGNAYICTLKEDGKWSSKSDFSCQCRNSNKGISKIKFIDQQTLIITCENGDRYKKTITSGGGGSENSY
jgi:hypothetical protein